MKFEHRFQMRMTDKMYKKLELKARERNLKVANLVRIIISEYIYTDDDSGRKEILDML
jgi:hypothetical protein